MNRALTLSAVLVIAGCGIGTEAPVLADADVAFDAALVGTWYVPNTSESVVIRSIEGNRYSFLYSESEDKVSRFTGRLGKVKTLRVLDLVPDERSVTGAEAVPGLLPLHGIAVIDSLASNQMRIRGLNADSLTAYLRRTPAAIRHEMRDGNVVITAPTAALQTFLVTYAARPGVFAPAVIWARRSHQ